MTAVTSEKLESYLEENGDFHYDESEPLLGAGNCLAHFGRLFLILKCCSERWRWHHGIDFHLARGQCIDSAQHTLQR